MSRNRLYRVPSHYRPKRAYRVEIKAVPKEVYDVCAFDWEGAERVAIERYEREHGVRFAVDPECDVERYAEYGMVACGA